MNHIINLEDFWQSPYSERIAHPGPLKLLLGFLQGKEEALFDITFHARFAKRMFDVMKREGKDVQGFDRMQQSFRDSVEKIREIIRRLEREGFAEARRYMELSQEGMARLMDLISDLATVKDWLLEAQENG